MKWKNKTGILLSAFLLLGALVISHHEIWRDEMQAWLIAKNSPSLGELFHNLKYDGHGGLWHLLLFFVTRFDAPPFAMQVLHLLIAGIAAWIFLKYSPFSLLHKSLFIFGYFPLYEYSAISRNYALAMLFIFLFCANLATARSANRDSLSAAAGKYRADSPGNKIILLSIFLFALCQTHIYGLIIALCLALVLLIPIVSQKKLPLTFTGKAKLAAGAFIAGLGIILGLVQMVPPSDSGFATKWITEFKPELAQKVISTAWQSFVPIPSFQISFWNSNILDFTDIRVKVFLSILLFLITAGIFLRKPIALILFFAGLAGMLLFTYVKYYGFLRHFGNIYILFIAAWWISYYTEDRKFSSFQFEKIAAFFSNHRNTFLTAILSVHLAAGAIAVYYELRYPFSHGEKAAEFLKKHDTGSLLVETSEYFTTITVAGFLGEKVYHPQCGRSGSFVVWDKCSGAGLDFSKAFESAKQLSSGLKKEAVLIAMQPQDTNSFNIIKIAEFSDSAIVADERYFLYKIPLPK